MSLVKTLVKVAIGVAIVKGVSSLAGGSASAAPELQDTGRSGTGSAGRGSRYDGGRGASVPRGLDGLMDDVLRGGRGNSTRSTRSERGGDLLDEIMGSPRKSTRKTAPQGGLQDVLEQMTGARTGRGGGQSGAGGLGDLLGSVLGTTAARPGSLRVEDEDEISAALMLRAIIQAVKCDGAMDAEEKRKLTQAMGDADPAEVQAVNAELQRPVDVEALVRMVPNGMEAQVYLASLSAIDLDQQAEAQYLHALAQALELTPEEANALHDRAGAPRLYR